MGQEGHKRRLLFNPIPFYQLVTDLWRAFKTFTSKANAIKAQADGEGRKADEDCKRLTDDVMSSVNEVYVKYKTVDDDPDIQNAILQVCVSWFQLICVVVRRICNVSENTQRG